MTIRWNNSEVWYIVAGLGVALLAAPAMAQTPGETVLYAFQGGSDGENVVSGLVAGSGGVLYGTTQVGGGGNCTIYWSNGAVVGCGTVFELTPPATEGGAWTERILYAFRGGADGAFPNTLVAGSGGVLYGTALVAGGALYGATTDGGSAGDGTVFKLTLATSTTAEKFASIYSFKGGSDGAFPSFGVIAGKSGVLYGATNSGGGTSCNSGAGCGIVYELTPPTTAGNPYTETILYAFPGGSDGANPAGRLSLLSTGALLGAAGGGAFNYGEVYELAPPAVSGGAWTESVLTSFDPGNLYGIPGGTFPNGEFVVGGNGSIYGTTYGGGDPNLQMGYYFPGTIFELTPPIEKGGAWVQSMLYSFQGGTDGLTPVWGLIVGPEGTLYGTTSVGGGTGCPAQAYNGMNIGCGTVFQFTP
ncbi:MAG: choice-of-anchor tandem repeat GloVer-containing protein [Bryobacteraceae bacterium]